MMSENRSCMFLLFLSTVAGLLSVSGAGITLKYVCPGDSVQAFQNIAFNNCNADVSLHINGDRNAQIAMWSVQNCIRNERLLPEYQGRLIFDQTGTITIKNFDHFDQAKYVVISKMDPLAKIYEVQLSLMVAPTKACKPTIEKLGNSLIASLKANDCGKPVAIPYWKDYSGVSNTNEPILKLTPGMEAKEYYACIKGAALTCVKNVMSNDYCTTFKTEGSKSPPASSETCNADALIVVCIILGILLCLAIVALAVIFILYRLRENNLISQNDTLRREEERQGENVNDEQMTMLLETPKPWTNDFGKLNWEAIRKLLNDDQQMGLQTYCDNLISQNDTLRREEERQGDVENDREEVHNCNDPDKIRELTELRDADRCKICLSNKMSVVFLPCRHITTCSECSSSLAKCPICRAVITDKLTICF